MAIHGPRTGAATTNDAPRTVGEWTPRRTPSETRTMPLIQSSAFTRPVARSPSARTPGTTINHNPQYSAPLRTTATTRIPGGSGGVTGLPGFAGVAPFTSALRDARIGPARHCWRGAQGDGQDRHHGQSRGHVSPLRLLDRELVCRRLIDLLVGSYELSVHSPWFRPPERVTTSRRRPRADPIPQTRTHGSHISERSQPDPHRWPPRHGSLSLTLQHLERVVGPARSGASLRPGLHRQSPRRPNLSTASVASRRPASRPVTAGRARARETWR